MLSNRQQRIIEFIRQFWGDKGYPPTIREIGQAAGISSTSVVGRADPRGVAIAIVRQCPRWINFARNRRPQRAVGPEGP